jgi:hypothetical protein
MLDSEETKILWDHMMEVDQDPSWISEWFLDRPPIESISRYDVFDFICWAMFDGRNEEHLTSQELQDLEALVEDREYLIALHLYGEESVVAVSSSNLSSSNLSSSNLSSSNLSSSSLHSEIEDEIQGDEIDDQTGEIDIESVVGPRDRINSDMATTNISDSNLVPFDEEELQEFDSPKHMTRGQVLYDETCGIRIWRRCLDQFVVQTSGS